jgi:hypothetical protein
VRTTPLLGKIFEIDCENLLHRILKKMDPCSKSWRRPCILSPFIIFNQVFKKKMVISLPKVAGSYQQFRVCSVTLLALQDFFGKFVRVVTKVCHEVELWFLPPGGQNTKTGITPLMIDKILQIFMVDLSCKGV